MKEWEPAGLRLTILHLLKEALNPGENQQIFAMTPLGYPKTGFQKTALKKRKPLDEIVEFL